MAKILIIKHGSLGDVILSLYAIYSINKHFKKSTITILTEKKYASIFLKLSFIKSIKIDNRPKFYSLIKFIDLLIWFYKSKFDWVFDLQTSNRTKIYFMAFSMFNNFRWSGIEKKCSHPHLNINRKKLHTIERQKQQLQIAGIKSIGNIDWQFMQSNLKKFNLPNNFVILVPGGSSKRLEKRWKLDNFLEVIKYFSKKNIYTILVGGTDELKITREISIKKLKCKNLIGKTDFFDIAALARRTNLIIGNDTGPMHLLSQCSRKSVKKIVLFGSNSNPSLCAPVAKNVFIIQKKSIDDITFEDLKKIIIKKI